MSAALSQPDAARFTLFIDAMIESPRLNFSAFCQAAHISAADALAWLNRAEIKTALQSCMDVIQLSARIRHAVLDTNAMGTLGQILKTSENQIELRRVATTIITRHKADLRASRATDPLGDQCESASLPPEGAGDFCQGLRRSSAPADEPTTPLENPPNLAHPSGVREAPHLSDQTPSSFNSQTKLSFALRADNSITPNSAISSSLDTSKPCHLNTSSQDTSGRDTAGAFPLSTQYSAHSTSRFESHSAKSLLTRAGSTRSRDHP